jgi:hypothetical protein
MVAIEVVPQSEQVRVECSAGDFCKESGPSEIGAHVLAEAAMHTATEGAGHEVQETVTRCSLVRPRAAIPV